MSMTKHQKQKLTDSEKYVTGDCETSQKSQSLPPKHTTTIRRKIASK